MTPTSDGYFSYVRGERSVGRSSRGGVERVNNRSNQGSSGTGRYNPVNGSCSSSSSFTSIPLDFIHFVDTDFPGSCASMDQGLYGENPINFQDMRRNNGSRGGDEVLEEGYRIRYVDTYAYTYTYTYTYTYKYTYNI